MKITHVLCAAALLASFVSFSADWSVQTMDGAPRLCCDGTPVTPFLFTVPRMRASDPLEVSSITSELQLCRDNGVRLIQVCIPALWGDDTEAKARASIRELCDAVIAIIPDAQFLPRVYTGHHGSIGVPAFIRDSFRERCLSADGNRESVSIASPRFRSEAVKAIQRTVRFMEETYGDHIIGYHVGAGEHNEFLYVNHARFGNLLGYDEWTQKAFKAFVAAKYPTDDAYRTAWKCYNKRENATVPPPTLRIGHDSQLYHNPQTTERAAIDFNEYLNDSMASLLIELCQAVRDVCAELGKKRVTAAFYGYVYECFPRANGTSLSGHFALEKVLASNAVDILCGPFSYANMARIPGGTMVTHTVPQSILAHGKLWLNEDDTGTYRTLQLKEFTDGSHRKFAQSSIEESVQLIRRNLACTLARNYAIWWFDLFAHGIWNDAAFWAEAVRFDALSKAVPRSPYSPDVIMTFDEKIARYICSDDRTKYPLEGGTSAMRISLAASGCATGSYLLNDVLAANTPSKLDIHANITALSKSQRDKLRQRAQTVPTVWMLAPGYIDTTRNEFSLEAVRELTGFRVAIARSDNWAVWGTPDGNDLGIFDVVNWGKTLGTALTPILEPGDILLARYRSTWVEPAVVLRPGKDGKPFSIFCGTNRLPASAVRAIAALAGAHVYTTRDAGINARDGFCAITGNEAGMYDVILKGTKTWYNVVTGKKVGTAPNVSLRLEKGETALLCDEDSFNALCKLNNN